MLRKPNFNPTLLSAYLIVCAIVVSAAVSRYDGLIQLKLGWEGAQLTIDGRNELLKPR